MALLGLHEWVYKETSCAPWLTLIKRIPQDTRINEDLPYKERPSLLRNRCQLYATIKTTKSSQIKIRIIYPRFDTLELWKFFNLTFGGYLADTKPVLSTRSSSFLFCKCCLKHMRIVRFIDDFWHHQSVLISMELLAWTHEDYNNNSCELHMEPFWVRKKKFHVNYIGILKNNISLIKYEHQLIILFIYFNCCTYNTYL